MSTNCVVHLNSRCILRVGQTTSQKSEADAGNSIVGSDNNTPSVSLTDNFNQLSHSSTGSVDQSLESCLDMDSIDSNVADIDTSARLTSCNLSEASSHSSLLLRQSTSECSEPTQDSLTFDSEEEQRFNVELLQRQYYRLSAEQFGGQLTLQHYYQLLERECSSSLGLTV